MSRKNYSEDRYEILKETLGIEIYNRLEEEFYQPTRTYEWYDPHDDQWYNQSGQEIRNPDEYDPSDFEYMPFGDE